ncbi:MAG: catechol 2,3-dioxygenase [Candidatus Azotimanducaceae bacterium]|jgi:catechol 2,3-dioxygenase
MKLSWSHAVLNVRDEAKILDFYTGVMGFTVSDRGLIGENGPSIIFMSQDPDEHHQLAVVTMRQDEQPANSLNHLAFRVESFDDVKTMKNRLVSESVDFLPLSHGNTLSLYFADPEGNGLEVFWDTPWHVGQPDGIIWDTSSNKEQALAWVEETFRDKAKFSKREDATGDWINRP